MRSLIILRWWLHLSFVPRCLGIFPYSGGSSTRGSVLHVVRGDHSPVDVEAFPCRVVAVGLGVGVWLGGVKAPVPLLHQLLPERGEGVPPWSQASRPAYLGKTWTLSLLLSLLSHIRVAREGQWPLYACAGTWNIVLASDVVVLSKPNGSIRLVANKPCGNRADGGDGGRGMLSLGAVARPLCYLSVAAAVLVCGAVGPSPIACPTRGVDRAVPVGRWRC